MESPYIVHDDNLNNIKIQCVSLFVHECDLTRNKHPSLYMQIQHVYANSVVLVPTPLFELELHIEMHTLKNELRVCKNMLYHLIQFLSSKLNVRFILES